MRVLVFSARSYDREFLSRANTGGEHEFRFTDATLAPDTAALADGFSAVCCFVDDDLGAETLGRLGAAGVEIAALRCAGFNNVDLNAAREVGITVTRVPRYSPHAVAEYTVGLILSLDRKIHRAYARVREGNFALEGLMGFDLHHRTVGVIGAGRIGSLVVGILSRGFGCRVLVADAGRALGETVEGAPVVELTALLADAEVITLHCPLTPETHHLIDGPAIDAMRPAVMLVNASRGAVVDTRAVIDGIKREKIGSFAMDVYEEEGDVFFRDLSDRLIEDDVLARLMTFPNVLITGHQGFFTREALGAIAEITMKNLSDYEHTGSCENALSPEKIVASGDARSRS